jgi:putative tricarboxylic transport membrane protein
VIGVLSIWLGMRSLRGGALASGRAGQGKSEAGNSTARLALAAGLGLLFVVGLIGRMPFWLAAAIFVTLFIAAFEWRPGLGPAERVRPVATALLQGLVTGVVVTLVFERLFLVRLP